MAFWDKNCLTFGLLSKHNSCYKSLLYVLTSFVRIMGHLAQFSRELYGTGRTESKPQSHGFPNKWTAPLVGMNIEHLKAFGSRWT